MKPSRSCCPRSSSLPCSRSPLARPGRTRRERAHPRQRRRHATSWTRTARRSSGSAIPRGRCFVEYTPAQAEAYLANRGKKGFTVVQGGAGLGPRLGFEMKTPLANKNGNKPWLNDDPATPNEAYFTRRRAPRRVRQRAGARPRHAADMGLLRERSADDHRRERPHLRAVARRAVQEPRRTSSGSTAAIAWPLASRRSIASSRADCARATAART